MTSTSLTHTKYNALTTSCLFRNTEGRSIEAGSDGDPEKQLCGMDQIELLDGAVCSNHVHMYPFHQSSAYEDDVEAKVR